MKPLRSACLLLFVAAAAGGAPARLPGWREGFLDIHHINTGCGNAAWCVLPDGTTLLVDAGANDPSPQRHVAPRPDAGKTPGAWIADYIIRHTPPGRERKLDYFLATHFHSDHIGGVLKTKSAAGDYYITGITEVAEHIPVEKIIDRDYPKYEFPSPAAGDACYKNYRAFIKSREALSPGSTERFRVGANDQFVLKHDPEDRYAGRFEIRNLIANGVMWTGSGERTTPLFPSLAGLSKPDMPEENSLSCGIRLSYGDFDYFTAGDLTGYPKPGRPAWHDLETPLAPVVGPVEVCRVSHHGYNNATNEFFIKTLAPRVFIIEASDALHPNHSTLARMLARQIYPGARDIFSTNLHPAAKIVIGALVDRMKSTQGHIVIRVPPGGADFMIYILDDSDAGHRVKAVFGPYESKRANARVKSAAP